MRVLDKIKRDMDKAKQEMDKEALPGEVLPSKWVCNYIECAFGMDLRVGIAALVHLTR